MGLPFEIFLLVSRGWTLKVSQRRKHGESNINLANNRSWRRLDFFTFVQMLFRFGIMMAGNTSRYILYRFTFCDVILDLEEVTYFLLDLFPFSF